MIESRYLKDNIENIQRLMSIPALRNFETRSLGKLLRLSRIREYEDKEQIIQEGASDPWLYFLLEGEVTIVKGGIELGRIKRLGEIFGEMRIVDSRGRSASAFAVGETICLAVNTQAGDRLKGDGGREDALELLVLLYRIFAEYMSIRLRLTSEELMKARKLIEELTLS
ncbi:MAG: cyclic nucleotide-binding domain-containing protein [Desulfobacterales bacterium]|jgi:CRP-like cAMP-binding protein